jgi:quercetin dioxygenase-like cupin family protein
MLSAKSDVQVDTAEVRVTEWRLAPGSATGHHIHEMDYVIVPVTAGEMTIVAPNGERSKAKLGAGKSYFRKAGVEHDVLNETASEIVFLEVELKPETAPRQAHMVGAGDCGIRQNAATGHLKAGQPATCPAPDLRPARADLIRICTADRAIATDPSQLIPQCASKFQHQIGLGEWPEC